MKTTNLILHWAPRVICILAIGFISSFSLDILGHGSFWEQTAGLLIHNIPSFILAGLLLYAWRHEKAGGIIFLFMGIFISFLVFLLNYTMNDTRVQNDIISAVAIGIPFVAAGLLFLWDDKKTNP